MFQGIPVRGKVLSARVVVPEGHGVSWRTGVPGRGGMDI